MDGFTGLWRAAGVDTDRVTELAQAIGVPLRVARWLWVRGLDETSAAAFLDPERVPFSSPYLFQDMDEAVDRLLRAAAEGTTVAVVGDYDVDGVTATAILTLALSAAGAVVVPVLPHRERDGYGLSPALVDRALAAGARVVVTVDNGIAAADAVAYAGARGLDVVVTDHHEPGPVQPPAQAIVHWSRADAVDHVRHLSGAGVAWKLATALLDRCGGSSAEDADLRLYLTGLAAVGTVADVMPMRGENRRLVRTGLHALRAIVHPGWLALCERAGVVPERLTDEDLVWRLVPRLNAAGRMAEPDIALKLLTAGDPDSARRWSSQLEVLNEARRRETERAVHEARCALDAENLPAGIVVAGPWRLGLAGIVAAKLVEAFGRPVIALADDGGDVLRGSGRAPTGFPLHEAVTRCAQYLEGFGGHAGAVGVHVARHRMQDFQAAFAVACADVPAPSDAPPEADDYLPLSEVSLDLCRWVERFRPYGPDNPPVTCFIGPVRVLHVQWLGNEGRHARIRVEEEGHYADLVWFDASSRGSWLRPGAIISAWVVPEVNEWHHITGPRLRVVTAQPMDGVLQREIFAQVYRLLRARRRVRAMDVRTHIPQLNQDQAEMILESFVELGFARREESAYDVNEQVTPRDLRESRRYQRHLWVTMQRTHGGSSVGDRGASV